MKIKFWNLVILSISLTSKYKIDWDTYENKILELGG